MTDQHPLTDEMIRETFDPKFFTFSGENTSSWYNEEDMRAAYDLAVDKAVDEFGYVLYVLSQNYGDILDKQDISDLVREFREELRPTTTQEDN